MQKPVLTVLLSLLTAFSASLSAAPVGYSVNSDGGSNSSDGLYLIDLDTGEELQRIGTVQSNDITDPTRRDVEGLAFAPDGTLYGVDDETAKLFRIDITNARVDQNNDYDIQNLTAGDNDFGMTFACDDQLYITSVTRQSLYRLGLDGSATLIGSEGSLGVNINALAAYGNPIRMYGLGNGTSGKNGPSNPNLYQIDVSTGTATEIGSIAGPGVGEYTEGGLAFDDSGQLWAITDRSQDLQPSQVMRINTSTGTASDIASTSEEGFESLAITIPRGCAPIGNGDSAAFVVQKRFSDDNNITPVNLNIKCNDGLPLEQSQTVLPAEGKFEVRFVVENFNDGALECEVWEDPPAGYSPDYDCQSGSACSTNAGAGPCTFSNVTSGQEDLCLIQNHVSPVSLTVTSQWLFNAADIDINDTTAIQLFCSGVRGGDGDDTGNGTMHWSWIFVGNPASHVATIYPDYNGSTKCWTTDTPAASAIESESSCEAPISISVGDTARSCTVVNTVFLEGIPALSPLGLMLVAALMLLTGLISLRRLF